MKMKIAVSSSTITLLFAVSFLWRTSAKSINAKSKRDTCNSHFQCGPLKICDSNMCRFIRNVEEIQLKTPCPLLFKAPCKVNTDCICNQRKMVCEEGECVFFRKRFYKQKNLVI